MVAIADLRPEPAKPLALDATDNIILIGKPGSGKTRVVMERAFEHLRLGKPVVILDALPTYHDWCKELGGRYTWFFEGEQCASVRYGGRPLFVHEFDIEDNRAWCEPLVYADGREKEGALLVVDEARWVIELCVPAATLVSRHARNRSPFLLVGQSVKDFEPLRHTHLAGVFTDVKTVLVKRGEAPEVVARELLPKWLAETT